MVRSRGGTVGLDWTRIWCDAAALGAALDSGRPAEALALYRGDLLEGFFLPEAAGFEQWLEQERSRYRAAAARAARQVAEQREADGSFTTAVSCARRAVELAELDERALRHLIELLDRLGDRAGALQAYDEFATRLAQELDAEPGPETQALMRDIRSRGAHASRRSESPTRLDSVSVASSLGNGDVDVDRWRVERELSRTSMSTVYVARDVKHDRPVALKTMHPAAAVSPATERFLREIQITAHLAHPHILPLLDSGTRHGVLYLVTPFVPGESLRNRLRRDGRLELGDAVRLATEVAEALDYAHRSGVIHRDIKPENILLADGHAVVADFGVAGALEVSGMVRLLPDPDPGAVVGSRAYMSPEQSTGTGSVSPRADLYSFGCVLYEMLTGELALGGETAASLMRKRADVPAPLAAMVAACLAPEEAARPSSAREVLARGEGLQRPVPARRKRLARVLVAAAFVFVTLIGAWWYKQSSWYAAAPDWNLVAVFPFRVTAADSSLAYLRAGVVDLHNIVLTGERLPRAVDTRTILKAHQEAARQAGGELTVEQAIAVARRLGAGRAVIGELVGTSGGTAMTAQLVNVTSGEVIARHAESTAGDELVLTLRLISRLLARSMGEALGRLPGLSDSVDAVKAYIGGLQATRDGQNELAFDLLGQALDIDPTFAAAALWRARVGWGAITFGSPVLRRADSVAWSLREHLSQRDQLILASRPTIGPHYPAPSTVSDIIEAMERAALANPDRPEVWTDWARYLGTFGHHAGVESRLERVAALVDRAIALDSTFVPALRQQLWVALERRDPAAVRLLDRRLRRLIDPPYYPFVGLSVARVIGDSADIKAARALASGDESDTYDVYLEAAHKGPATVEDAELVLTAFLQSSAATPALRRRPAGNLVGLAALRGRPTRAIWLADSLGVQPGWVLHALSDPGSGYDSLARAMVPVLEARADTMQNRAVAMQLLCSAQLWRLNTGDTLHTRRVINQMRALIRTLDPGQAYRIGPLGLCPLLLEAAVERFTLPRATRVRDSLETILRRGVWEVPGNLAKLIVARWRVADGEYREALEIVRRSDPSSVVVVHPAMDRLEGRLRAALGDTAGAVGAYTRYLRIRDQPEPGLMTEEVRAVRRHLAELVAEGRDPKRTE